MNSALFGSVAALAWGTHDFLARFPSRRIGPVNSALGVTVAGFLILGTWLLVSGAPLRIVWPSLWLTAVTGVAFAIATLALYGALAIGPISIVAPIAGSYPALAVLFALIAGERPALVEWLAVGAVMAGVVLVAQRKEDAASSEPTGSMGAIVGLSLVASLGFAIAFTSGQAAVEIFGEAQSVWLSRIFGLVTVGLVYLRPATRFEMPLRWMPVLGAMGLLDVTALAAVTTAGSLPDPAIATVVSSGFGAVSVILAWVFIRERISLVQLLGIVLIFGGVVVLASR
jgi:drug/metabolite transporter (DMT)-like permease